jgi:hypothetical protein
MFTVGPLAKSEHGHHMTGKGSGSGFAMLTLTNDADLTFVEGTPDVPLMATADQASGVIEACFSHGTRDVLLYATNKTPSFFDLSSREAGTTSGGCATTASGW